MNARDVPCAACGVSTDDRCVNRRGRPVAPHGQRIRDAALLQRVIQDRLFAARMAATLEQFGTAATEAVAALSRFSAAYHVPTGGQP